ncbi:MAG: apolipoprotein N-acyltransferase [Candidatus Omnitrophica bacterium]|nr:apolipoprotein N-acyltransferase [Candidatus Omnitrophota bacterium]
MRSVKFLLAVLSGIILSISFPPFNLWYLAFIGFIPLFFSLEEKDNALNFFKGCIAGFVFYTIGLSWIFNVAGFAYLFLCLYFALWWGTFTCIVFSFPPAKRIYLGIPLWFFIEIIITHLLTGFPWLLIGFSQWNDSSINQFASLTGVYGISCLVLLSNFSITSLFRKKRAWEFLSFLIIVAAIMFFVPHWKMSLNARKNKIRIYAVQADAGFVGEPPRESFYKYWEMSKPLKGKADLIIWPESSFPSLIKEYPSLWNKLLKFSRTQPILFGSIDSKDNKFFNAAFFLNRDKYAVYHKLHLVPYGEYLPGKRFKWFRDIYKKENPYHFIPDLSPGKKDEMFSLDGYRFSPLICYENIFPGISRKKVLAGSQFLITLTNDSWFGKSFGPWQHFTQNVFRAIENRRYVLQVSTTGITGLVSPGGKIEKVFHKGTKRLFTAGVIKADVFPVNRISFYTRWGNIPLAFIFFILMVVIIYGEIDKIRKDTRLPV